MLSRKFFGSLGLSLVALCFSFAPAFAQDKSAADKDKPAAPAGGMDAAAMQAMMDAAKPGPHHKALESMAGKFKYTIKFKMDPSQDWSTSEGDYEGQSIMDGRYITYTVKGQMMGDNFVGMGCLGYDNTLKKHVAAWIDNMGTGIMRSEGTCSNDDKTITFEGEMMEPATKKMTAYKYVYEMKSPDEWTMRWWSPSMSDGKMFESMVIDYKRVKE